MFHRLESVNANALVAFCSQFGGHGRLHGLTVAKFEGEAAVQYNDVEFGAMRLSPDKTEYPRLYRNAAAAARFLKSHPDWELSYWTHSDIHMKPLDKYRDMRGHFPGCPTQ